MDPLQEHPRRAYPWPMDPRMVYSRELYDVFELLIAGTQAPDGTSTFTRDDVHARYLYRAANVQCGRPIWDTDYGTLPLNLSFHAMFVAGTDPNYHYDDDIIVAEHRARGYIASALKTPDTTIYMFSSPLVPQ